MKNTTPHNAVQFIHKGKGVCLDFFFPLHLRNLFIVLIFFSFSLFICASVWALVCTPNPLVTMF